MTTSLRTLVVLVEPPLPFGHAVGRWYYVLLRGLKERGERVTALVTCSSVSDFEATRELFPAPDYDVRLFAMEPARTLRHRLEAVFRPNYRLFSDSLRTSLREEMARGYDVLHLESTWAGWLGLDEPARALLHIHNLYTIDLSLDPPPASAMLRARRQLMLRAERELIRHYTNVTTLTPRLTEWVRNAHAGARLLETIPLGMDASLYEFRDSDPAADKLVVGLVGSFHWGPTRSAATRLLSRLWPEIKRRVPAAELWLVGRSAGNISYLVSSSDVVIHADVKDTIPFFRAMSLMLYAPGAGSGMKVKVLEAFALGTPVVTTHDGVEGLSAVDGEHAFVRDDDAGLIDAAVVLLKNAELRARFRRNARALLVRECSPDATVEHVLAVHRALV